MDMSAVTLEVIGGIGLFLLGMSLMTEGLKSLAGEPVRKALMRFTRSPSSGVMTGILATIVTQSSSATIIITVGFVGAGMLAYSQALGVVLGASVGTTFTGWMVAIIGFKLKLATIASPLIFIGAFLRLFGGSRRSGLAFALAGFGLVFVGIDSLQSGMAGLQEKVDLGFVPADHLWGKLVLMVVGTAFTLLTQSSTAGVISALAALHSGVINFEQAAALVVGMNVGTTFTSAIATIGGNVHVRRTGFSHVVFNTIVSGCALFLITPYIQLWHLCFPDTPQAELALVAFHTLFNLVGVLIILPFIGYYARFIARLFPERGGDEKPLLDTSLLKYPELALTEVSRVLAQQMLPLVQQIAYILGQSPRPVSLAHTGRTLNEAKAYIDQIHLDSSDGKDWTRLLSSIHLLDHMQRLHERCQNAQAVIVLHGEDQLTSAKQVLMTLTQALVESRPLAPDQAGLLVGQLQTQEQHLRELTMQQVATGSLSLDTGVSRMETARWMHRVGTHLVRIYQYLGVMAQTGTASEAPHG
ncbi:Na/Pi cotransporter family protein [Cellvibrio japonicus]|uniref:Na/Pi cotransporter family protein n=1 Tax=Cellvibrio japonicus (strain Ueda107) TaxID=498211 RepID=B3PDU2_CELJU|nr:Na/Pi symporter [Cellvibrio japonicus]ACE85683.1 Na/Pi cotransporter family protein [Cellvibrio japonicus Ueda107]QEI13429.1 Na/Pi cotransporter family protein [Cellvibrio japonicus]QEI17003.1 Na/Pi cotransporter family protein [Cellvibrio japonicus]QEI20581.1 Na/Pi cotransporter family protein [Cellvibrio japonicus]